MENDLSRILDDLPALVWTALPDGDVDFVNQRWCDYTGLTLDAARALGWQTTIHPVHRPELAERWRSSQASGQPVEAEVPLRRFDHMHGFPLRDVQGHIVYWFLLERNVDERKRAVALLAGEKHVLEMVATGVALTKVLDALCISSDATRGCYARNIFLRAEINLQHEFSNLTPRKE